MNVNACYKPGVKAIESVKKNYSKTTNKDLISKYNSEWINKVKEKFLLINITIHINYIVFNRIII